MERINKPLLVPVAAMIALIVKNAFGIEISNQEIDTYINGILACIGIIGIFMNPKK